MKQTYTPPKMTDLGSTRELTLGNATGSNLDQDFPAGTPFTELTFS